MLKCRKSVFVLTMKIDTKGFVKYSSANDFSLFFLKRLRSKFKNENLEFIVENKRNNICVLMNTIGLFCSV